MKKKLYIDIDGVLGDLVAAVLSFSTRAELKNPYAYNASSMFNHVRNDIFKMPELYSQKNFKLYPFVGEVLRRMEILGFEIMFISARPYNERILDATLRTIRQLELKLQRSDLSELRLGVSSNDKVEIIRKDILLNEIEKAWVIEDNPHFVMNMARGYVLYPELKKILKTLVYLQPFNDSEYGLIHMLPEFTGVINWKHVEQEITKWD